MVDVKTLSWNQWSSRPVPTPVSPLTSLSSIFQTISFQASGWQTKPFFTFYKSVYVLTSGYPALYRVNQTSSLLIFLPMERFLLTTGLQGSPKGRAVVQLQSIFLISNNVLKWPIQESGLSVFILHQLAFKNFREAIGASSGRGTSPTVTDSMGFWAMCSLYF